jgi:polar amino acid transport system substrate-binding protein
VGVASPADPLRASFRRGDEAVGLRWLASLITRLFRSFSLCSAALLAGAVLATTGCGIERNAAGTPFAPAHKDVLTVATAFVPAPGFWQGKAATAGFEAGLAAALARHLGVQRVHVIQVPFAEIVGGKLDGADIALSQLTPASQREHSLDFTTPYLRASPGILAPPTVHASDIKGLRSLRWVVSRVSTLTPVLMHRIRPLDPPVSTLDRSQALRVLRAGRADALLLDLPVALGLARAEPSRFHVLAQLAGGEGLAVALRKGSPNTEIVDSAVRALQADGTIGRLESRWLGRGEDSVPLILSEG